MGDLAPGERATLWLRAPARDAGLALSFACGDAARHVELDAYVPRRGSSGHTVRVTTCTTAAIATDHWLPSPLVPPLR